MKLILACLVTLPAIMMLTGCNQKELVLCGELNKTSCATRNECRYLDYEGDYKPGQGLCVVSEVPAKECRELTRDFCSLSNYLGTKKCRPSTSGMTECEDDSTIEQITPEKLFKLSAKFQSLSDGALDAALDEFNRGYRKLNTPALKKALADQKGGETEEFLLHRLARVPMRVSTVGIITSLLEDENFIAQLNKKDSNGSTPIMELTGLSRNGDVTREYNNAIKLFVKKGADLSKLPPSNIESFLKATDGTTNKDSAKNLYLKMERNPDQIQAWISFLLENANEHTQAAFKEICERYPLNTAELVNALLTIVVEQDLSAGVIVAGDKLKNVVADGDKWFDIELSGGNFNLGQDTGALPLVLAALVKSKHPTTPWTDDDTDYVSQVVLAMKPGIVPWAGFANPLVAPLTVIVGDEAVARRILGLETTPSVWDTIKGLNLSILEDRATMGNALHNVITSGTDAIFQLLTTPGEAAFPEAGGSGGLALIHKLLRSSLAVTKQRVIDLLTPLSPEQRQQVMAMSSIAPGLPVQTALADLFFRSPGEEEEVGEIAALLSNGLTNGPMIDLLVDLAFAKIIHQDFMIQEQREKVLNVIAVFANLPVDATNLKKLFMQGLANKLMNDGEGLIHMLLGGPVDAGVVAAFNSILANLESPAKKSWVEQVYGTETPLSMLLIRSVIGDVEDQVQLLLNVIAGLEPNVPISVIDKMWNLPKGLDNTNFATEVSRTKAMVILNRLAKMADGATKKALVIGLFGNGSTIQPRLDTDDPQSLIESMPRGKIDEDLVRVFETSIAAQDTPEARKILVDQHQDLYPSALLTVTDGTGDPGSRIGNVAVNGDDLVQVKKLLTLLILNGADLTEVIGVEGNINRTKAIYNALIETDHTGAAFVAFVKNADMQAISWLASWAGENATRAPAIKAVMESVDPLVTPEKKIALKSDIFVAALDYDITNVVIVKEPVAETAPPHTLLYIKTGEGALNAELPRFKLLMDNLLAYGLLFTKDSLDYQFNLNRNQALVANDDPQVHRGSLIWLLTAVIANNHKAHPIAANKIEALVKTISHKDHGLRKVITEPIDWRGYVNSESTYGTPFKEDAIIVVKNRLGALLNVTAMLWLNYL